MLRIAFLAFTVAFTGAVTPGPMLALVIGQTLAGGPLSTMFILIGHALVELVFVGLLAKGLSRILQSPVVGGILSVIGGGVLIWMGATILGDLHAMSLHQAASESALSWYALVLGGMGVSLSNPYFTSWWATVGSGQMAALQLRRPAEYTAFLVAHEMGDIVWYGIVTVALAVGQQWLNNSVYRILLAICGIAVVVLGVVFLVIGFRFWRRRQPAGVAPADSRAGP